MAKKGGKFADNIGLIQLGYARTSHHPLIEPLPDLILAFDSPAQNLSQGAWLTAVCRGYQRTWYVQHSEPETPITVWPNIRRRASPDEWTYVLARMRLHIVLNHIDPDRSDAEWTVAACIRAEELLTNAGIGKRPDAFPSIPKVTPRSTMIFSKLWRDTMYRT